jgi:hypothetical protein
MSGGIPLLSAIHSRFTGSKTALPGAVTPPKSPPDPESALMSSTLGPRME